MDKRKRKQKATRKQDVRNPIKRVFGITILLAVGLWFIFKNENLSKIQIIIKPEYERTHKLITVY